MTKLEKFLHFLFILGRNDQRVSIAAILLILNVDFLAVEFHLSTGLIHQIVDDTVDIVFVLASDNLSVKNEIRQGSW